MKLRNNGSRIFMTELMFAILYFIVIAAICVQCFSKSYLMSRDAKELNEAVNIASNAAEEFYGINDFGNFTTYYDKDWCKTTTGDGYYKATGIVSSEYGQHSFITTMSMTVTRVDDDYQIYSMNVKKAIPLED